MTHLSEVKTLPVREMAADLDRYIDRLVKGIETLAAEEPVKLPMNEDLSYALPALFFFQKRLAKLAEPIGDAQ